jgi:tetratricopeptide (TPR) repeat protein
MSVIARWLAGAVAVAGLGCVCAQSGEKAARPTEMTREALTHASSRGSKLERVADYIEALKKKATALETDKMVLGKQVAQYREELALARQQITDLKAREAVLSQEAGAALSLLSPDMQSTADGVTVVCPWARLVGALTGESAELLAAMAHDLNVPVLTSKERQRALSRAGRKTRLPRQVPLPANSPELARALSDVALALQRAGRDDVAEAHFAWAVMILESSPERNHLATAIALENLGNHYLSTGGSRGAEGAYRLARGEYRYLLEPDHPKLAGLRNRLAAALHRQGRTREAEELYLKTISIYAEGAGRLHPNLLAPAHNLAKLYLEQGRREEAAIWLERAQQIVATHAAANVYAAQVEQTIARFVATQPEPPAAPEAEAARYAVEVVEDTSVL